MLHLSGLKTDGDVTRWAIFDETRSHRLLLGRCWGDKTVYQTMVFVGLNPSQADHENDDQTIRKEIGFAKRYGCGGIIKANLLTVIETESKKLSDITEAFALHDQSGSALAAALTMHGCGSIRVAAWGQLSNHVYQMSVGSRAIVEKRTGSALYCFGRCKKTNRFARSEPRHTSRIPYSTPLVSYATGALHPRKPKEIV